MHLRVYIAWLWGRREFVRGEIIPRSTEIPFFGLFRVRVLRAGRLQSFCDWCVGVLELENWL